MEASVALENGTYRPKDGRDVESKDSVVAGGLEKAMHLVSDSQLRREGRSGTANDVVGYVSGYLYMTQTETQTGADNGNDEIPQGVECRDILATLFMDPGFNRLGRAYNILHPNSEASKIAVKRYVDDINFNLDLKARANMFYPIITEEHVYIALEFKPYDESKIRANYFKFD